MNFNPEPYNIWEALQHWGIIFGMVVGAALVIGFLVSLVLHGGRGPTVFQLTAKRLLLGALQTSPRRVWALTLLTFREATRRKVVMVFVIFVLLFMFAGWFISSDSPRPEMEVKRHISFVMGSMTFLIIPVMLLLSCWGLPEDIKNRSLHTVVTKPARRQEVFLGRILGFSLIGTLILAGMGVIGYFWIIRQVPDSAKAGLVCRVPVYGDLSFIDEQGESSDKGVNVGNVWEFRSYIAGGTNARAIWTFHNITPAFMVPKRSPETGEVETADGAEVKVLRLESNFETFRTHKGHQGRGVKCDIHVVKYLRERTRNDLASLGPFSEVARHIDAENYSAAARELRGVASYLRSPTAQVTTGAFNRMRDGYADFAVMLEPFLSAEGMQENTEAINSLIAAANECKKAADNESVGDLADGIDQLAKQFETHDDLLRTLLVNYRARVKTFNVPEYRESMEIDLEKTHICQDLEFDAREGMLKPRRRFRADLFKDLIHGNALTIHVVCMDAEQYIGVARPDLYIRLPDRHFAVGYAKSLFSVWLVMILVVILGVTASSFLKGPVATLLVFMFLILGSPFHEFLGKVVRGELDSAGALESAYRVVNHQNPRQNIGEVRGIGVVRDVDSALIHFLQGVYWIIPDFENYRVVPYLANGFDVPWDSALLPSVLTTLGYLIPCLFIGYLSLALRELEEK